MLNDIYVLKEVLHKEGIFLGFSGPVSQGLMVEIGTILNQKMELEETGKTTAIRVFSMLVENVQNVIHYSAEKCCKNNESASEEEPELSFGIIAVGYKNGCYFVLCGNMVENKHVEKLREMLIKLRNMDKDELRKYYKEQRKKKPDERSKGGGLGFIDMARKASQPIESDFRKIDENVSFFSVKIVI